MQELFVIGNPSSRSGKRKRNPSGKRRSAAQKAATRKLIAWNKSHRRGPRRAGKKRKGRKGNPAPVVAYGALNPGNGKRRRRRNPTGFMTMRNVGDIAMSAFQGAAGAVAIDTMMTFVPLPANLKVGPVGYVTRGLSALAGGFALGLVPGLRKFAATATEGSLVVTLRDAIKETAARAGFNLGYYSAAPVFSYPTPSGQNLRGMGGRGMGVFMPSSRALADARIREQNQMAGVGVYFPR